jgi:hypothetical protein
MPSRKKRKNLAKKSERICCVFTEQWRYIGIDYLDNERVLVLLNNIVDRADLGPLQTVRHNHVEPEADILVIPREQVKSKVILELTW